MSLLSYLFWLFTLGMLVNNSICQSTEKHEFRVKVDVVCEYKLQNVIENNIFKELLSFDDIVICKSNEDFKIQILATSPDTHPDLDKQILLSVVILERYDPYPVYEDILRNANYNQNEIDEFMKGIEDWYLFVDHEVFSTYEDNLKSTCRTVVLHFDSKSLKTQRMLNQAGL